MSQRISSASGKAFLWLIAVAVACLMEGVLVQSSTWASLYAPAPNPTTVSVEAVEAPRHDGGLHRAARVVATVVRVTSALR